MPRVRQKRDIYLAQDLKKAILKSGIDNGLTSAKSIAEAMDIPYTTFLLRMRQPDTITLGEARKMAAVLPIERYITAIMFAQNN